MAKSLVAERADYPHLLPYDWGVWGKILKTGKSFAKNETSKTELYELS